LASQINEQLCSHHISNQKNIKSSRANKHCLNAAREGSGLAQYSVSINYGYAGQSKPEEQYLRLAAANQALAHYLKIIESKIG
jgi:hypothetical protein